MSVRRMLAEIDSRELTEWMAYEKFAGPLGGERGDLHAAMVAATVANTVRGKKPPVKVSSFVPKWDRPPQSVAEQKAVIEGAIRAATSQ